VPTEPGSDYSSGTVNSWARGMRSTVIHEVKHITMFANKFDIGTSTTEESGLEEATARLSEEFYARAVSPSGFGMNAKSAIITRGLAEIVRLGRAKGGKPETFMGLSGLGDLTLTCNAMQSRNFSLGVELGKGASLDEILGRRRSVAEGVFSAAAVCELADRLGVDMPICEAVDAVINHKAEISRTISDLLARPARVELS